MRTLRLVFIHKPFQSMSQGCEVQVFWCSRIFYPTPEVQLNHCLHRTPKLGIPVETVQLLLKLLWKQNSCCVPRFPLIASCYIIINSWLHSREPVWKVGVEHFTSDSTTLVASWSYSVSRSFVPVEAIAVFITRVLHLFETLLSGMHCVKCQYNISFIFPQSFRKRSLQSSGIRWPSAWMKFVARAPSSLWMLIDVPGLRHQQ